MKFTISRHVREQQAPAIFMDTDFILECASQPDRITFKENHPHQFELQKDLECGFTLAMAVDPVRFENTLLITTIYPKGITRESARTLRKTDLVIENTNLVIDQARAALSNRALRENVSA